MEDPATRGALLNSIETRHRELIWSEERRISALKKGKSPKTQQDSEREDELAKKLKDLADDYQYISDSKSTNHGRYFSRSQPNVRSTISIKEDAGAARFSADSRDSPTACGGRQLIAGEPLWNPFTSSYVYRETGFEPGPSKSRYQTPPGSIEEEPGRECARFQSNPLLPQETPEKKVAPRTQVQPRGLPYPKPAQHSEDGSTAAPSAGSRPAWSPFGIFKWMMSKKKKEPSVGKHLSYLKSTKPGSGALGVQGDQGDLGGRSQASGDLAARFEKLRDVGLCNSNESFDGPQKADLSATHTLNPWSLQATADQQARIAEARTSPRPQVLQPSGTHGSGNSAAAEHPEWRRSRPNMGNDHLGFGEHDARLEPSHFDGSPSTSLSKQEQQDREMAEQLVRDEELAASLQDLEDQARARNEASLMLAIKLAGGHVQDHDAFLSQQIESVEMAYASQRENELQELQLQADRELALRLQNEVSTVVSDDGLGNKAHPGPSKPRQWREWDPQWQQTHSQETLAQEPIGLENTGWADNAQRFSNAERRMSVEDRNEPRLRRWTQPAEDIAYAQQLQQEFDQQEQWYIEAQRVQDTLAAEDRQLQDSIMAEQAEIKRQEQEDCLICTESYDKDDMRVSAMLSSQRNLISVVKKIYKSILLGGSLVHGFSNDIKTSSWNTPRQTLYIVITPAVPHSYDP